MQLLFKQCLECKLGISCYEEGFKSCPKIEAAGDGLGIPVEMVKDTPNKVPFGVYMSLKHMIEKSKNIR